MYPDGQGGHAEAPRYVAGALAGGFAMGLPNAFFDCCCFIWGPLGGIVAVWFAGRAATWFGAQEGALVGACAGAVGWLIQAAINIPLTLVAFQMIKANPALLNGFPPEFRQALQQPSMGELAMRQAIMLVMLLVGSTLGGLLAGQTFLRREPGFGPGPGGHGGHDDSRPCPVCGERIKVVAIKCRFCGTSFGPPAPPASP